MTLKPIVSEPIEVDNLLEDLGLDRAGLTHSVHYAEHEKSFVTTNDPLGFANYVVYAKSGRALREYYLPKGWHRDDSHNQTAIKNPEKMIRVVPCNFNEFAGNPHFKPTNKSPKGEISRKKSACNRTAWLPGLEPPVIEPALNDGYQTWVLGIYTDDIRPTGAELSLPVDFDGKFFTQFATRALLLSGEGGGGGGVRRRENGPSGPGDDAVGIVDIQIKRK